MHAAPKSKIAVCLNCTMRGSEPANYSIDVAVGHMWSARSHTKFRVVSRNAKNRSPQLAQPGPSQLVSSTTARPVRPFVARIIHHSSPSPDTKNCPNTPVSTNLLLLAHGLHPQSLCCLPYLPRSEAVRELPNCIPNTLLVIVDPLECNALFTLDSASPHACHR